MSSDNDDNDNDFMYNDDDDDDDDGGDNGDDGDGFGVTGGNNTDDYFDASYPEIIGEKSTVSYVVIDEANLIGNLEKEIESIAEILSVQLMVAGILLKKFHWDKDKLLTAYYEHPEKVLRDAGVSDMEADALGGGSRVSSGTCGICGETFTGTAAAAAAAAGADEPFLFQLSCHHVFCSDCWAQYLGIKINDGQGCETLPCPGFKCQQILTDGVVKTLVPSAVYARYVCFISRSFVTFNPSLRWCPAPNCMRAIELKAGHPMQEVQCDCGHSFCFNCGEAAHYPAECEQMKMWSVKIKDDSETYHWMTANTKPCPKCHLSIEKNSGCNHMICIKCNHHFCWICLGAWAEHGNSYYNCNKFDPKSDKSKHLAATSKALLDRYLHYYTRYTTHDQSLLFESKATDILAKKMQDLQEKNNKTWIDLQYLLEAAAQLHQCRRTLKYSYVYGYYLESKKEKDIFEFLQQGLEKNTEDLSGLLEQNMEALDRTAIITLTRVAATMLRNLRDALEEGLIAHADTDHAVPASPMAIVQNIAIGSNNTNSNNSNNNSNNSNSNNNSNNNSSPGKVSKSPGRSMLSFVADAVSAALSRTGVAATTTATTTSNTNANTNNNNNNNNNNNSSTTTGSAKATVNNNNSNNNNNNANTSRRSAATTAPTAATAPTATATATMTRTRSNSSGNSKQTSSTSKLTGNKRKK